MSETNANRMGFAFGECRSREWAGSIGAVLMRYFSSWNLQKRLHLGPDMQHDFSADCGLLLSASDFPIERLHLIRQDRALHAVNLGDYLEWMPFDLVGYRATDHQACFAVVVGRTDHQGRTVARLFMPAREVEAVLKDIPEIVEVAVLGVPDDIRKEEVKAYVFLQLGLTPSEVPPEAIIEHARRFLAAFKVPRYMEYRGEFPRTPSNKIRKPELMKEKSDLRLGSWDRVDGVWR